MEVSSDYLEQRKALTSTWSQRNLPGRADPWAGAQWTWSGRDGEEHFRQRQSICQAWRPGGIRGQLRKGIGRNLEPSLQDPM